MARTEHSDPEAEKNFTDNDVSTRPMSADTEGSEITDPNGQDQKNNMLRTMSVRSTLGRAQQNQKAP